MNNIICEIVSSTRGNDKINVHGYLMVKDRNRNNQYYWRCEKRGLLYCTGRAVTTFVEQQHRLCKSTEHNHAAEASRMTVLRTVNALKRRAQDTDELPAQIIRTVTTSGPPETHPYLPSSDALRQTINRLRHSEFPVEPTTLGELNIPEHLTRTLDGTQDLLM